MILLPLWAIFTAIEVLEERSNWEYLCDWNGCPSYVASTSQYNAAGYEFIRSINLTNREFISAEAARVELQRRRSIVEAHQRQMLLAWVIPASQILTAFVFAMLTKVAALWVWRGFRPLKQ